jgi:hypothetical protein
MNDLPDINAIPDIDKLSEDIVKIVEYIQSNKNHKSWEQIRIYCFGEFENVPPSIIRLLTQDCDVITFKKNIHKLIVLFESLKKVKDGAADLTNVYNAFETSYMKK